MKMRPPSSRWQDMRTTLPCTTASALAASVSIDNGTWLAAWPSAVPASRTTRNANDLPFMPPRRLLAWPEKLNPAFYAGQLRPIHRSMRTA